MAPLENKAPRPVTLATQCLRADACMHAGVAERLRSLAAAPLSGPSGGDVPNEVIASSSKSSNSVRSSQSSRSSSVSSNDSSTVDGSNGRAGAVRILDCGCGSAYLTLCTFHYLNNGGWGIALISDQTSDRVHGAVYLP